MERTLLLATAAVMMATMAQADGTFGAVSTRTIGAAVSSAIRIAPSDPYLPSDPYQPGVVRSIRNELPPNPVFPADEGPGPDDPFGSAGN